MRVTKAVIPAAGRGKRLGPVTSSLAKEMLPIGGKNNFKPYIHYVVDEAIQSGLGDVLIITRPGKQSIQHYFDIMEYDSIHYKNQRQQLGLGHAVLQADAFVKGGAFAVLLGDDLYVNCPKPATKQLIESYKDLPDGAVLIGVERMPKKEITQKGMITVKKNGSTMQVIGLIEKPELKDVTSEYAISGRYILPSNILKVIRETPAGHKGEVQLTDAIRIYLEQGSPVYAMEIKGARLDIGNPVTYLDAQISMLLSSAEKDETVAILRKYTEQSSN